MKMDHFCFKFPSWLWACVGSCFTWLLYSHTAPDEWDTDEDVNNVVSPWVTRGAYQFPLAVQYGMMPGHISREGEEPHLLWEIPWAIFFCWDPSKAVISTNICVLDFKDWRISYYKLVVKLSTFENYRMISYEDLQTSSNCSLQFSCL